MTNVLILGGTGWLSGRIAQEWLDAGAAVTCLARGTSGDIPDGAVLVRADREDEEAYDEVAALSWDEVVDVSSDPSHVEAAVEELADSARHWTYISTVSVYATADEPGADETAAVHEPVDLSDYGQAKVAAERLVLAELDDRAAIIRPGLIAGPGDRSDRFGCWVARFAAAGDEPVLVPDADGRDVQVIDVDDLAGFVVRIGKSRWRGIVNAVGPRIPLADVLRLAREEAGHTGAVVPATDDWLHAHDVQPWAGPRSLPLWLPREMTGFARRSNAVFLAAGGECRDIRNTLARTLADERTRGLDRPRRAGLERAEERALLAELGH